MFILAHSDSGRWGSEFTRRNDPNRENTRGQKTNGLLREGSQPCKSRIVANPIRLGCSEIERHVPPGEPDAGGCGETVADTDGEGLSLQRPNGGRSPQPFPRPLGNGWEWWESEPGVGRVANGIPNRVDRLKGLGNAIVPQVAYELFRVIGDNFKPNRHDRTNQISSKPKGTRRAT